MDNATYNALRPMLIRHENKYRFPYDDSTGKYIKLSTGGKVTIAVGRNLTDRGLSENEIYYLLDNDIVIAEADAKYCVGEAIYNGLSLNRKLVVLDMAFNLGRERLLLFINTLRAIKEARYSDAAAGMRLSLWCRQTGSRAIELIDLMEQG